jgi:transposase
VTTNVWGLPALDPNWAGGRPRRITTADEDFIVATVRTRPEKLARPFTRWSTRKLVGYLADNPVRRVLVGRERLRQYLHEHQISFRRTRTWKESTDSERAIKLDRIEEVSTRFPQRCFAFDQFGPLRTFVMSNSNHGSGHGHRW